jgi:hypothetical protein
MPPFVPVWLEQMLAALAALGRRTVAAASVAAQAPPIKSLTRPRLRLAGWVKGTFMCVLPPREGWLGNQAA